MSIFSSVTCPKCKKRELSIGIAFSFNKIRVLCCDKCGYWGEINLTNDEFKVIEKVFKEERIVGAS